MNINIEPTSEELQTDKDFMQFCEEFYINFGLAPHKNMFIDYDLLFFKDKLEEKVYYLSVNAWQFWSSGKRYGKDQTMICVKSELEIPLDSDDDLAFNKIKGLKIDKKNYLDLCKETY